MKPTLDTMPIVPPWMPAKALFQRSEVLATEAQMSQRRATCAACEFNQGGVCRQCCGGVPIETLIRLAASQCQAGRWDGGGD